MNSDTFERACREADRKAAAQPQDHRLKRPRRLLPSTGAASCLRAGEDTDIDWRQVALAAWEAPGWREAALDYHRERSPSPPLAASRLVTPEREIWRAAGHCIRRKAPCAALRTFLGWCDRHGVSRSDALPIFTIIVDKELAR
jgi:hypothetical protein